MRPFEPEQVLARYKELNLKPATNFFADVVDDKLTVAKINLRGGETSTGDFCCPLTLMQLGDPADLNVKGVWDMAETKWPGFRAQAFTTGYDSNHGTSEEALLGKETMKLLEREFGPSQKWDWEWPRRSRRR